MIISPIFYMGNKKKLIKRGLVGLFPEKINRFFDVFGGSGVVSLNVEANKIYLNDTDSNLYALYNMFKEYSCDEIIKEVEDRIQQYGLAKERTKRNEFKDEEKLIKYKEAYMKLRSKFNKTRSIFDFYTLMFYSFSQQFRFNSKGEFNMPVGNDCFSEQNKEYIRLATNSFKSMNLGNYDFRHFSEHIDSFKEGDFLYLDPPYMNTTAVYNENDGWNMKDEMDLLTFLDELDKRNIKWGLSNVFECRGKTNDHLIQWCSSRGYKVFDFKNFSYVVCGKGDSKAKEVYITNI